VLYLRLPPAQPSLLAGSRGICRRELADTCAPSVFKDAEFGYRALKGRRAIAALYTQPRSAATSFRLGHIYDYCSWATDAYFVSRPQPALFDFICYSENCVRIRSFNHPKPF
jgi:hypothetical protein